MAARPSARWHGLHTLSLAAVALVAAGLATATYYGGPLKRIELSLYDARFSIAHPKPDLSRVAVVAIDARTEGDLGRSFPFRRTLHARMIDRLRTAGARVIAYDIEFNEPRGEREDLALLDAIDRAKGRVVLATSEVGESGRTNVLGGPALLREVGARAGDSSLLFDTDGVIRRLTYRPHVLPTFAAVAAKVADPRELPQDAYQFDPPAFAAEEPDVRTSWIDFAGPPGSVPTYSFSRVLDGRVPANALRGRIVVVGATNPAVGDVHRTSASDRLMAGPGIQANAIASTLARLPLRNVPPGVDLAVMVLLTAVPVLVASRRGVRGVAGASAVSLTGFLIVAQVSFAHGRVLAVAPALVGLLISAGGAFVVRYAAELRARRKTRQLFTRFVPEHVVDDAIRGESNADLRLGVKLDATVLFSDLRGFTAFAEQLPEEKVGEVLNRYLGTMTEAVTTEGGTVVSYMGDGIMAVFGAPAAQDDHADRALAAAVRMLARLTDFNEHLRAEGLGEGFRMGVGLNSGKVISGNVGSDHHLEYAAIGDTTNIAARLEAMTKESGHSLLLADSTRTRLTESSHELEPLGHMDVRGREEAVEVWALASLSRDADAI